MASGILNVWQHDPADVAAGHAELARRLPDRFLLGIGVGHPEATSDYTKPLTAMREFFDGLDAAEPPVPREERIAAALGPKMLDLAAERSLGTHPYFTTPSTRASPASGSGRTRSSPPSSRWSGARRRGGAGERAGLRRDLPRPEQLHEQPAALRLHRADIADGGSDRLIDAVIPHGSAEAVADAVRAHLDAGADHVCLQPLGHGPAPVDDYRALADVLL